MASVPSAMAAQRALSGGRIDGFTRPNKWLELENAVLLQTTWSTCWWPQSQNPTKRINTKRLIMAFMHSKTPFRKPKDLFNQRHDEVRQIRIEREDRRAPRLRDGEAEGRRARVERATMAGNLFFTCSALTLRVTDAAIAWLIQRNDQRGVHRIFSTAGRRTSPR
jgi:hypothetical protein